MTQEGRKQFTVKATQHHEMFIAQFLSEVSACSFDYILYNME